MAEGKCTFGGRPEIDIQMLNEIIKREVKHFRTYKHYRPDFGVLPITSKFYAAHDMVPLKTESEKNKVIHYQKRVGLMRAQGPHAKYPEPATENQVCGWYNTLLCPLDKMDNRYYHPKYESPHTKIEVIIRKCNPSNKI